MNKKRIIFVIILFVLILCSVIFIYVINHRGKGSTKKTYYNGFDIIDHSVNLCVEPGQCKYVNDISYLTVSYETKNQQIKQIVDSYNKNILDLYQKTLDSKLNENSPCGDFAGVYNYQFFSDIQLYLYSSDDYVILASSRSDYDVCADSFKPVKVDPVIYDLKKKKILSQEEFKKRVNVNEQVIKKSIDTCLEQYNMENADVDYNDVSVFYAGEQGLTLLFYADGFTTYFPTRVIFDE